LIQRLIRALRLVGAATELAIDCASFLSRLFSAAGFFIARKLPGTTEFFV
jgi:hypothetical protein